MKLIFKEKQTEKAHYISRSDDILRVTSDRLTVCLGSLTD